MTTADIVRVLRRESMFYYDCSDNAPRIRQTADAFRRAAKRLSRLADDNLASEYDSDLGNVGLDVYRRAVLGVRP
jgi:hypothetical protein